MAVIDMVRERLADIDRAKGLAITLVVLGHLSFDTPPAGNEWYGHLNLLIYKFHMAFFMFITGFVMFYTYPEIRTWRDYGAYARKKFTRIIPAYLLFALVIIVGKTIVGRLIHLENPVTGFHEFVKVILCPGESCCRYLWYIYAVFGYYLTVPLLLKLSKNSLEPLLVLALLIYFLPRSPYFGYDRASQYLFVFLLGGYASRHRTFYLDAIDRYSWVFIAAFIGCILLYSVMDIPKLLFGVVAIPALHSLVRLRVSERMPMLARIGQYAFPIYILNVLVTGGLLFFLQKYWSLDGIHYRVAVPVLFLSGLLGPIVFYELFIRRTPILNRIVRA